MRDEWHNALRALTNSPKAAIAWLDARYSFTCEIARQLVAPLEGREAPAVIYAVWLEGEHSLPAYIGQSIDPARRLWDLPIGESHHLANSFPPEIWRTVGVVDWAQMIRLNETLESNVSAAIEDAGVSPLERRKAIGLCVEFYLQRSLQPLFNSRKKLRNGGWRKVELERSAAIGAKCARLPALVQLAQEVEAALVRLADQNSPPMQAPDAWSVSPAAFLAKVSNDTRLNSIPKYRDLE